MSAPVLECKDNGLRQQNVSHQPPVSDAATSRPGILSLMRMMQRQKVKEYGLDDDYDQEWDLFCVLCEMLRTIIMNKMTCERPHEVDPFEKSYSCLESDLDRVKFIISHPDASCILKYFAREFHDLRKDFAHAFRKSGDISTSYQVQGRKLFQEGKFLQAAHKYSQAMKFSPISDNDTDIREQTCDKGWNELSRCQAERSACYFGAKEFAAAATDADLVLASGSSLSLDQKAALFQRKILSLKSLGRSPDAEAAFREMETAIKQHTDYQSDAACKIKQEELLSQLKEILCEGVTATDENSERDHILHQIHEDRKVIKGGTVKEGGLVNASHKLRLDEAVGRGRFITTRQAIAKDEVLIHESAVVSWLRPSLYQDYCFHCLKQFHAHFLLPCPSCALVAYCSADCRDASWREYHQHECRDLPILRHLSKGHMVSRILMMRRNHQKESQDSHQQDNGPRLIQEIDKLISHSNDYSLTTSLETCLGAVFVTFLMQLLGMIEEHEIESSAASLLTYLFQLNVNCLQIVQQDIVIVNDSDGIKQRKSGEETRTRAGVCYRVQERSQNPGYGLYLTSSFLNHSCFNTTKSFFHGNQLTFVSSQPFTAGDEITFNYGPHYKVSDRDVRRKYLSDLYFFTCDCKACHEDWK